MTLSVPRILVVLLNYRTASLSLRAARAALLAMQGLDAELLVVDNASGDGSAHLLRDGLAEIGDPRIRLILSDRNGGFGAGNNLGIATGMADGSAPDLIYVLNSDAFPAPDALRKLVDHLATHPKVAFAGSYIHGPEGDGHVTAFRFPSLWSELEGAARFGPLTRALRRHVVPMGLPDSTQKVDWLAGASILLRRDVLDEIGAFDETYFLYFEETDLCLRAARAGYETHYVRDSHVEHIGSASTGMKTWARVPGFWLDSRWHYFTKNHGTAYALAATGMHVLGGVLWRLRRAVEGKDRLDPPHFLRDLVRHALRKAFGDRKGQGQKRRWMGAL